MSTREARRAEARRLRRFKPMRPIRRWGERFFGAARLGVQQTSVPEWREPAAPGTRYRYRQEIVAIPNVYMRDTGETIKGSRRVYRWKERDPNPLVAIGGRKWPRGLTGWKLAFTLGLYMTVFPTLAGFRNGAGLNAVGGPFIPKSTITAKGDILIGQANATPGVLSVGADGTFLAADSTAPNGLKWDVAGTGGFIPWYWVGSYGAVQNGTTDDSAAIGLAFTAAAAQGGGVVLISGKCATASEIVVPTKCVLMMLGPGGPSTWAGSDASTPAYLTATPAATGLRSLVNLNGAGSCILNCQIDANYQADHAVITGNDTANGLYWNKLLQSTLYAGAVSALRVSSQDCHSLGCKMLNGHRGSAVLHTLWDLSNTNNNAPDGSYIQCHFSGGTGLQGCVVLMNGASNTTFNQCHVYPGTVNTATSITAATNASPIHVTSASHGFSNGESIQIQGCTGNTAANGTWTVANKTSSAFDIYYTCWADLTSGSAIVTGLRGAAQLANGATVTGTNIPGGTTISSVTGDYKITMTANATATAQVLITVASTGNGAYGGSGGCQWAGLSAGFHIRDTSYVEVGGATYVDGMKQYNGIDYLIHTSSNSFTSRRVKLFDCQGHNDNDTVGGATKYVVQLQNDTSGGVISGVTVINVDGSGSSSTDAFNGSACTYAAFLNTVATGSVYSTRVADCSTRQTTTFYTGTRPLMLQDCAYYSAGEISADAKLSNLLTVYSAQPGAVTSFTVAHGLFATPTTCLVTAGDANAQTSPDMYVTLGATNVTLNFAAALNAATTYTWYLSAAV